MQSKGLSRVFSNTTIQRHRFFRAQPSSQANSHPYMTTGKTIALTRRTFVGKVLSLLFNMLSRLVHNFSSKDCLSILIEVFLTNINECLLTLNMNLLLCTQSPQPCAPRQPPMSNNNKFTYKSIHNK